MNTVRKVMNGLSKVEGKRLFVEDPSMTCVRFIDSIYEDKKGNVFIKLEHDIPKEVQTDYPSWGG